jgi:acyl carrier protein
VLGANFHFPDNWGADSLDVVEIIMAFEEAFDEEISDQEMQKLLKYFHTKEELLDYLRRRKKGGGLN